MSPASPPSRATSAELPPVLVSILNWNSLEDTRSCLAKLLQSGAGHFDILMIDNGSSEDATVALRPEFPSVEFVRLPENKGFAGGQNHGMALAIARGYRAVLLLNNDCDMSAAHIDRLWQEMAADEQVAAVSPLIYWAQNHQKAQMVAGWMDWSLHESVRPSTPGVCGPKGMPTLLHGTALLLRCSALQVVGLLDERYFAYYEDNDLSARIAQKGFSAVYCQTAEAFHSQRPTHDYSAFALYLLARNSWLFWRLHTPENFRRSMFRHLLAQNLLQLVSLKKAGETAKCDAVVAGFWDAQRHRSGAPPARFESPFWLRRLMCVAPYLCYQFLRDPMGLIKAKWRGLRSKGQAA